MAFGNAIPGLFYLSSSTPLVQVLGIQCNWCPPSLQFETIPDHLVLGMEKRMIFSRRALMRSYIPGALTLSPVSLYTPIKV
jgi:hypothetical protein